MDQIKEIILEKVKDIAGKKDYLLVELVVRGSKQKPIIEVYIDNSVGVSADDCAVISREAGEYIDTVKEVSEDYLLVVSSPGTERPLKFLEQFTKHLNRKFALSYKNGDELKSFEGKLTNISDQMLTFKAGKEMIVLAFDNIEEAKVIISF